ncbi:Vacuolar protein sorting-associated protein 68 [Malassezia nana]|uniref:Vacuolar protein sorting-associated protein 68 n=1 Tax=Malassezia nana TaxID=180528 RepID=A0AAF0J8Z6_9BASI|nr:Vacuolar protein sorting-associated protein 68 [Malassezia nana]
MRSNAHSFGVYLAGVLFAAGWWIFFDACVRSAYGHPEPPPVTIKFDDWAPGLCTMVGLIIVNLVDKRLLFDEGAALGDWGADAVLWRARTWLFVGFACLAGGMAGSLSVLIVKYMLNEHAVGYVELGVAGVLQNVAMMACAMVLWFSQRTESDYEYNLTL